MLTRNKGVGYVSWNGATDVDRWAVYAGNSSSSLVKGAVAMRSGFETEFTFPVEHHNVRAYG